MTIAPLLLVIAVLLWFIWRQLARIAGSLVTLKQIAVERHLGHRDTP